ncbi:hypothetical protein F5050DRAFT_1388281 [Lentinula boryana]|uniref:Uncharacterized protein n=1 Tax=Lentinula boryana TaxID=40481 RepID=A0ABQ8PX16_9AGAR|nr:hypothetical protein F5050DRAFT_1388281 [Lentinula boryana]
MFPVLLHKLAILVCLGLLSRVSAMPVRAKTKECSRPPLFNPKMPMGYAYYDTERENFVGHSSRYPIRIHSAPKPPHDGHHKCLVYDKGYFSDRDLRLLYVPEEYLFNENLAVNYVGAQGFERLSTIMVSVSSTSNLLDTMIIPSHLKDVVRIDCLKEEEQEPIMDWTCLTIVGLKE